MPDATTSYWSLWTTGQKDSQHFSSSNKIFYLNFSVYIYCIYINNSRQTQYKINTCVLTCFNFMLTSAKSDTTDTCLGKVKKRDIKSSSSLFFFKSPVIFTAI